MRHEVTRRAVAAGMAVVLAVVCLAGAACAPAPRTERFPAMPTVAVWEWRDPGEMSDTDVSGSLAFLAGMGVNTVYLNIGRCIELSEMDDATAKAEAMSAFDERVSAYIVAARAKGIEVHALAGGPDWAEPSRDYLSGRVLDYVAQHQSGAGEAARFAGVQFDIEFYLAGGSRRKAFIHFLDLVQATVERVKAAPSLRQLKIGYAIPLWLDSTDSDMADVPWSGTREQAFAHLAGILASAQRPYLAVMAYRNRATGRDGSIAAASGEIAYCAASAPNVSVVVGQDVIDVTPAKVTFFALGRARLLAASRQIERAFSRSPVFAGIAVNHAQGLQELAP